MHTLRATLIAAAAAAVTVAVVFAGGLMLSGCTTETDSAPSPRLGHARDPVVEPLDPNRWADVNLLELATPGPIVISTLLDLEEADPPVLRVLLEPNSAHPIAAATYAVQLFDRHGQSLGTINHSARWHDEFRGMILVDEFPQTRVADLAKVHTATAFVLRAEFADGSPDWTFPLRSAEHISGFPTPRTDDRALRAASAGFIVAESQPPILMLVVDNLHATQHLATVTLRIRAKDAHARPIGEIRVNIDQPIPARHRLTYLLPIAPSNPNMLPPATATVIVDLLDHRWRD